MTEHSEIQESLNVDRLRALRARRGWSQRELARRCEIGEAAIGKYESGLSEPSSGILKRIANVLGVSADYLLGLTDDPNGHLGDDALTDEERAMVDAYRRAGWPGVARVMADMLEK